MPNTRSAVKALRQSKKRSLRNRTKRRRLRDLIKKFEDSLKAGKVKEAQSLLPLLYKSIDKAAKKGRIFKKNTAARKKSSLAKKLTTALTNKKS